jgi:chloramphenicol 3-O-phosphotransferase
MIIVINGPPGVGKTSVSKALTGLLPGTVCIHGDHLRAFAPEDARAHLGGGSTYKAAASLALTYLGMGAPRVIFDYCFLRPRHVGYFTDGLGPDAAVHIFTLWATLKTVQARELGRVGRTPLGAAVEECHREIEEHLAELGTIVDAENETADMLARALHERLPSTAAQRAGGEG